MADVSTIFSFVKKLANGVTDAMTAEVLRERINLINDQLDILKTAHEAAQKELADCKAKCNALENEVARYREAEQFVIKNGAAFKKDATGRYRDVPLCPRCHNPIGGSGMLGIPMQCIPCGHITSLHPSKVDSVVAELNKSLE
ncbi:MAG: hypothetical protein J6589_07680 [Snodgrassella sp.]|uniref:hypothetical protein n=1 Tax=Snodgrassella sp. TaxID=2815304 RepID=UPI002584D398|nr:hypothetical protein [Snodgrassella sp.]MCO6514331.1 hypothetical protein [Snodgrassella sp.]MCO6520518.1 hypothetical protein [Snodgrassella sp.]